MRKEVKNSYEEYLRFWTKNQLNKKFAAGDTAPLPKKGNSNYLKNYRPIYLLNHSFKATTKIINNRLKNPVSYTHLTLPTK